MYSCVIRISKILLYAIHNYLPTRLSSALVVLSGFQRYFCMQYTTVVVFEPIKPTLCYQDFKDTFVCNTQQSPSLVLPPAGCVIRISKILLYAIHNYNEDTHHIERVVLSGFQRYFCMQYTTVLLPKVWLTALCYQDFKDTFVCNTQLIHPLLLQGQCCVIRISKILLYAIHNKVNRHIGITVLCYQDFKDTFVCNTQPDYLPC